MRNTSVWAAYRAYYDNVLSKTHNNPDLLARWGKDLESLETQIMCKKQGLRVPDSNMHEEDGEVFGPARWPYNAGSDTPSYSDPPIQYIIGNRLQCIGSTFWNWRQKRTVSLGFDFDSIVGHAAGVGVSDAELAKLDKIDVPWIEVIRSTRGGGRHLYIHFQEPQPITLTHTEHAALARSFIPLIAKHTGLDIEASVDVCGGVMWIHHVDATKENRGYTTIKPATQILTAEHVPPNWRDHLDVVSGSRTKVKVQGWAEGGLTQGDELDEMTQAHAQVPLDEAHLKMLDDLEATGHSSLWVHDHHLWQGHTGGLKQVFDQWLEAGHPMKGLFDTNSMDSDPGKPNCFARPKPNGGWDVYRFGEGTNEHPVWGTQGKWTHTTLNFPPTLKQIAFASGGYEGPDEKAGYLFDSLVEISDCLKLLNSDIEVPANAEGRSYAIRTREDGQLVLVISKERGDKQPDFPRFSKAPKGWERLLVDATETSDQEQEESELWAELDDKFRALKTVKEGATGSQGGLFSSWVIKDEQQCWTTHPRENVKSFLVSAGFKATDPILGGAIFKSWQLTNDPFQPEYPGGRIWNRNAAQYVYPAAELNEDQRPHHPHWDRVMNHCGVDLDQYISKLDWPRKWGITKGGDYLTAWVSCMLRHPYKKLPYLFMYGPQNSGKSIFHEACSLLMTNGVVKADRALTSPGDYNGELMDAVLGVVDEVDISKAGLAAYNKLKDWTMGLTISIHAKYRQVEEHQNTLHFCQMANTRASLPVFPGDTRITAFNVPSLEEEIPKDVLLAALKVEAPHFMRTLFDLDIPDPTSRLMIPVIETQGKLDAVEGNMTALQQFVQGQCHMIAGAGVAFKTFKDKFIETLDEFQRAEWPDSQIKKELSEEYPIGRSSGNINVIGNMSFTVVEPRSPYIKNGSRIMRKDEE